MFFLFMYYIMSYTPQQKENAAKQQQVRADHTDPGYKGLADEKKTDAANQQKSAQADRDRKADIEARLYAMANGVSRKRRAFRKKSPRHRQRTFRKKSLMRRRH